MPNTVAELDKELGEFKKWVYDEIARLKTMLDELRLSDEIDSKADNDTVESLENELKALKESIHEKLEKLNDKTEKNLKEWVESKVGSLKEKIDDNTANLK
jgi:hypothetical protein